MSEKTIHMHCPKCSSFDFVKSGNILSNQRYLCKVCGCQFTKEYRGKSQSTKRLALQLYLEGCSLREIAQLLKTNHTTIFTWLKNFNNELDELRSNTVEAITIKELQQWIEKKKNISGYKIMLLDIEVGCSKLCVIENQNSNLKLFEDATTHVQY